MYKKYWRIICIALLAAVGIYLRARNLGYHSLYASDEGVVALAVKGILESGKAFLPVDAIYPRSPLTLYLMAFMSRLFGFNDVSLRSVGVFFSALMIPLGYLVAKEIFKDKLIGLLTAGILTFSAWQIEIARQVKFYAPFGFFYLLSIYLFYKGFFQKKKKCRPLFLVSYIAIILTNLLGVTLITAFLLYAISKKRLRDLTKSDWIYFFTSVGIFLLWAGYSSFLMYRIPDRLPSEPMGLLGYTDMILPNVKLLSNFFRHTNFIFCLSWFGLLAISSFYAVKLKWLVPLIILAALQQIVLAGLYLLAYIFFKGGSISFNDRRFLFGLCLIFLFFVYWGLYGFFVYRDIGTIPVILRQVLRELLVFNFPHLVYPYMIGIMFPIMAIFVGAGLILLFNTSCKDRKDPKFLAWGIFLIPMLFIGASLAGTHHESRHISNLYPFFVMIYAYSLVKLTDWMSHRSAIRFGNQRARYLKIVFLLLFLSLTIEHISPKEALAISERRHGEKINPMFSLSSKQYIQMDFKGTAQFVKENLGESDIVVYAGSPPNIFFYYIGRVDFTIRPKDKIHKRILGYTSAEHITLPEFQKMVSTTQQRVWLIVTKDEITLSYKESRDLVSKITDRYSGKLKYISSDNNFEVYLF